MEHIHSEVPFGVTLHLWLDWRQEPLDHFASESHRYEQRYLAWETVRKVRNPFFVNGSGFEGYFVGRYQQPEDTLDAILLVCQQLLDRIARLHRFDGGLRRNLLRVLLRERSDTQVMQEWAAQFGATVGTLRTYLCHNPQAQQFQAETYRVAQFLPPIHYSEQTYHLEQDYAVAGQPLSEVEKLLVEVQLLKPIQQEAWLVAEHIGEFGHPLVREYLAAQSWWSA